MLAVNVAFTLVAQASLQYLWDMIAAQQLVILLPLFKIELPKNVSIIFTGLVWIAAAELIPTDYIYLEWFKADIEGNPIETNFEDLGFEHHLLLNNFGTLGFFLLFILPVLYIVHWITDIFQGNKCCRRISIRLGK